MLYVFKSECTCSLIFSITISCLTILFYELTSKKGLDLILSYIQKQLQIATIFFSRETLGNPNTNK